MKTIWLVLAVIATIVTAACQVPDPPPRTVTEVFDRSVSATESMVTTLADAMPEDKYEFAPVNGEFKGVRTFGQMVKHIAVDQYVDAAALLKEKAPIDIGTSLNGPDSVRSKAQILEFLRAGFAYMHKAMRTVNQKNLMELVNFQDARIPRLTIVTSSLAHPMDHYGQLIEYLRMNGIDPQARR